MLDGVEDAPDWILAMIPRPAPAAASPATRMAVPAGHAIQPIREGERNDRLFRIARGCRSDGFTEAQILARLRLLNSDGTVSPPMDDAELVLLARQGARVPAGAAGHPDAHVAEIDTPSYHRTDLGNAQRLVDRHAGSLYWLTDAQVWLVWDGKRFKRDSGGELVMQAAQETVTSLYLDAANSGSVEERKALGAYATSCEREGKLRSAISLARSQSRAMSTSGEFDCDPALFKVQNGTLDLSSGTLRPHDRSQRITRMSAVEYDENATSPTWDAFLLRVMDDRPEMVEYLRRAVGYSLTGSTEEHCLFMLHGTGANGKSTFVETICDLMGEYALRTQFSTWTASERGEATHEIAALAGARLVASNEAESGSRMAEGIIKQATGGDRMRGCFKYQNSFEFVPAFKLWLALNHKPLVRGTDEGLWRRMRLVPFSVTIPAEERDHTLRARLVAELPGILAWAVRGAFEWYHFGLQEPDAIREATLEYKGDQDTFAEWIDECLSKDERSSTSGSEIYKSFTSWCERQGIKPMANNKLAIMLKDRGFRNKKNRAGRFFWLGIGLVTEGDGGFDPIPNLL